MKNLSLPTVHIGGSSILNGSYLQADRLKVSHFYFILSFEYLVFCPFVLSDKYISI